MAKKFKTSDGFFFGARGEIEGRGQGGGGVQKLLATFQQKNPQLIL